jgi:hypothetical protein
VPERARDIVKPVVRGRSILSPRRLVKAIRIAPGLMRPNVVAHAGRASATPQNLAFRRMPLIRYTAPPSLRA